jgi:hypothetical protein
MGICICGRQLVCSNCKLIAGLCKCDKVENIQDTQLSYSVAWMTHPSNLAKWVTGVSDFEQMIKNLQLDVRLDKHIINTDLCQEWFSIKSRISPYEFLYKKI